MEPVLILKYSYFSIEHILPIVVEPLDISFLSLSHILFDLEFPPDLVQTHFVDFVFQLLS